MVEIGPRADEARRIATLPMEDRVCEIIELLKASSSRQAVLEKAAKCCRDLGDAERMADDTIKGWKLAQGAYKCEKAIRALATTPPAEGETK